MDFLSTTFGFLPSNMRSVKVLYVSAESTIYAERGYLGTAFTRQFETSRGIGWDANPV